MGRAGYETARLRLAHLSAEADEARNAGSRHALAISAGALGVDRVGIWLFDAREERIDCMLLYTASTRAYSSGSLLLSKDHPRYFEALRIQRAIVASDARHNPITRELTDAYLAPLGITSMLDAPIIRGGRISGVVCHEHVGEKRDWKQKDIDFASTVADMLALLFEQADRMALEASLMAQGAQALENQKNEAMQRLCSSLGHDINNVLAALPLVTARLREHSDPQVLQSVKDIDDTVAHAHGLAKQLLDMGRAARVPARPLDLRRAVERDHAALNAMLGGRAILAIEDRASHSAVPMDQKDLSQILLNLVANARDAIGDAGHVTVVLRDPTPEDLVHEYHVILEVVDDGAGMDEETRTRVFEPYFTTKPQGTGLGLALVHSAVRRAGGHIRVESEPGKGTRFVLALPIAV